EDNFAGFGQALTALPNLDRQLANRLATTGSVLSFVPGKTDFSGRHAPIAKAAITPKGGDPRHHMPAHNNWRTTLTTFEAQAKGNGATLEARAGGGRVRSLPLLVNLDGTLYPSNALEALRVAANGSAYEVSVVAPMNGFSFEIEPGIEKIAIAGTGYEARTFRNGDLRLYFGNETTRPRIPAGQILANTADTALLEGRIAVIGVSVNGSDHLYDTPLGIRMASGAIAANAIDQIANGQYLLRPGWVSAAEQLFILVAGLLVILVAFYASWWCFEAYRWLIDPARASVTLLAAALTCALMTRLHTEDEIRFVETQFGRRLPAAGLARIKANPRLIQAEGTLREV